MIALAEVQFEMKVHVANIGYESHLSAERVTLVADYAARVIRIGQDLDVPFERVMFMRRAAN